jgi:hypothetical protein
LFNIRHAQASLLREAIIKEPFVDTGVISIFKNEAKALGIKKVVQQILSPNNEQILKIPSIWKIMGSYRYFVKKP